ncbi:MAG TPA: DUF3311 domain-containing protein [Streptosporangiaceae bacterium]|nr:DUF3311 domain-containing protein [Streptosporangiaceae bacterium]
MFTSAWDKAPYDPASAAAVSDNAPQTEARHTRPGATDRSRWHWLLVVAVVVPLLTPLYDRTTPVLFGVPFFYWSQLAFVVLASCMTFVVYQATKRRGR